RRAPRGGGTPRRPRPAMHAVSEGRDTRVRGKFRRQAKKNRLPSAREVRMKLYRGGRFAIAVGDITKLEVDAVVNSTNPSLAGGFGVDGAIHAAAGPELRAACEKLGGAAFGEARLTPGFRLPATWVIHVAGPIWRGGTHGEEDMLERTYRS